MSVNQRLVHALDYAKEQSQGFRPRRTYKYKPKSQAIVYVAADEQPTVKIGLTYDLDKRLRAMRSTSGRIGLNIIYHKLLNYTEQARAIESKAHRALKQQRLIGEWFTTSRYTAIEAVRAAERECGVTEAIGVPMKTQP